MEFTMVLPILGIVLAVVNIVCTLVPAFSGEPNEETTRESLVRAVKWRGMALMTSNALMALIAFQLIALIRK
jgi:hypothetical protein